MEAMVLKGKIERQRAGAVRLPGGAAIYGFRGRRPDRPGESLAGEEDSR